MVRSGSENASDHDDAPAPGSLDAYTSPVALDAKHTDAVEHDTFANGRDDTRANVSPAPRGAPTANVAASPVPYRLPGQSCPSSPNPDAHTPTHTDPLTHDSASNCGPDAAAPPDHAPAPPAGSLELTV